MKTRRSPSLGVLAFYPLIVSAAVFGWLEEAPFGLFGIFAATVLAVSVVFSVHAFRRAKFIGSRRMLWIAGFWLIGPVLFPVYWWTDSYAT